MNKKVIYLIACPILVVFWLLPLLYGDLSIDAQYIKSLAAYVLFIVAVLLCRLLPNRHAALISAAVTGAGLCVLHPVAAFDIIPVLLLCCWLRCYTEYEKGNAVRVCFELFTDLIYVYLIAAVIRLIRNGYSFMKINATDIQTVPDLCLMSLVFLFFFGAFIFGASTKSQRTKSKKKKARRAEKGFVGVIPVYLSLRTFWGFCVLLLTACLLQFTNGRLLEESFQFARTGFRLLFLPWMVLLFLALDAFLPEFSSLKRILRR